jgi:hypothetical protein
MYFELKFCTIVVHEIVYNQVFLFNFFETLNLNFFVVQKTGSTEPVHQNDALAIIEILNTFSNLKSNNFLTFSNQEAKAAVNIHTIQFRTPCHNTERLVLVKVKLH